MSKVNMFPNINLRIIIWWLILILVINMVFSYYSQAYLREGMCKEISKIKPTQVTIKLIDRSPSRKDAFPDKSKPVIKKKNTEENPAGLFNIYTEYDSKMTQFKIGEESKVSLLLINDVIISIKPAITETSIDKFPASFIFNILFDKKKPPFYLTDEEKTNSINSSHELEIYTNLASISNSSYANIGSIMKDPSNPFSYTLMITEGGNELEAINIHFSTTNNAA